MLAILALGPPDRRRAARDARRGSTSSGTALSALGLGADRVRRSCAAGVVGLRPAQARRARTGSACRRRSGCCSAAGSSLWLFFAWENRQLRRGAEPLVDPSILRNRTLRGGLTAFFFQYLLQAGLFFAVPLFLSVALGLSAIDTGVRLLPLSITLLLAAAGIPKVLPERVTAPRRPSSGSWRCSPGIVVMVGALDAGAGRGDRDLADAARRSRDRGAGLAAWAA